MGALHTIQIVALPGSLSFLALLHNAVPFSAGIHPEKPFLARRNTSLIFLLLKSAFYRNKYVAFSFPPVTPISSDDDPPSSRLLWELRQTDGFKV